MITCNLEKNTNTENERIKMEVDGTDNCSKTPVQVLCTVKHSDDFLKSCVWAVNWNPHGTLMVSSGADKTIKVWRFVPGTERMELLSTIRGDQSRTIRYISFSPCGRFLASASFDASIIIYEMIDGNFEEIHRLEGHENEVKCCVYSASGDFLATCSRDKSVWVWQVDEEGDYDVDSILQTHTADVKFCAWHPTEELLVSGGYDCSIRFYRNDGEDWVVAQKLDDAHEDTVWAGDFDPDGEHFVSVGADHTVKVWQRAGQKSDFTREWSKICDRLVEDTQWPFYSVAWASDGERIAVGGGDMVLRLFTFDAKNQALVLAARFQLNGEINCIRWKPSILRPNVGIEEEDEETIGENGKENGMILSLACDDGTVYLLKYHKF